MTLHAGTRLGPYEITGSLGSGSMGEVYRANDSRLRREVAIKVSGESFSDRFDREDVASRVCVRCLEEVGRAGREHQITSFCAEHRAAALVVGRGAIGRHRFEVYGSGYSIKREVGKP